MNHSIASARHWPTRSGLTSCARIAGQGGELPCKKLVDELDVSPATISHHLKELTNAGLIEGRREGQCMMLSARRAPLEAYQSELRKRLSAGM